MPLIRWNVFVKSDVLGLTTQDFDLLVVFHYEMLIDAIEQTTKTFVREDCPEYFHARELVRSESTRHQHFLAGLRDAYQKLSE